MNSVSGLAVDTRPLCIDLDGTLCRSDTLVETLLWAIKAQPWLLLVLPFTLLKGRAAFKQRIAQAAFAADFKVQHLPWHLELVAWLRNEAAAGRTLVLCTGADTAIADAVATHFGFFSHVIASDGTSNLTGSRKRIALVEAYGEKGFDYAGNEPIDIKVWASASQAIVAEATPAFTERVAAVAPVALQFPASTASHLKMWLKALRVHQWVKNVLIFLPLMLSHTLAVQPALSAVIAFIAFSLCASSVYLLNDLLDLEDDRRHPRKRERPFAAAQLSLTQGLLLAPLLLLAAFTLAALTTPAFVGVLAGYYLLTLAYSLYLKREPTVDVMTLAALYTLRVIAGAAATGLPLSFWLLAFSMFLFLSLGVVKRYAEMRVVKATAQQKAHGRGYHIDDLPLLRNLGVSAGYGAVLVLALYINSPESLALYRNPHILWLLCPLVMYWVSRVWLKTHRGEMHDDPIVFALKDRTSRLIALISMIIVWVAI